MLPRVAEIVGGRPRARRRGAARLDGAARRRAAGAESARGPSSDSARLQPDELEAVRALADAVAAFCEPQRPPGRRARGRRGRAGRAPLAPARVGRHLRAGRARVLSVLARDGGRAGARRRRRAHRGRDAEGLRGDARRRARARNRRGLRGRRRAGGRRARVRHGDDRAGRQDRRPREPLGHRGEAAGLEPGRDRPSGRAERGRPDRRCLGRSRALCAPTCSRRPSTGPTARRSCSASIASLSAAVRRLVGRHRERLGPRRADARRGASRSRRRYAPEHLELWVADPEPLLERIRNAGTVFVRTSAVVGDYAAGATHVLPTGGLARGAGGLGLETFLKPIQVVRGTELSQCAGDRAAARPARGAAVARGRAGAGVRAQPLPAGFRAYAWSPSSAEVASRHGLRPEQILRYDQNTPPVPGVPQVPLAESFARLNEYPDGTYGELREAAAGYCGVEPEQVVVGAGADELILLCARTYLGPGELGGDRGAHLRALPDRDRARGSVDHGLGRRRGPDLGLQPEQPDRRAARPGGDRRARPRASRRPRSSSTRPTSSTRARPVCR